jgi:hypothetical protein
MFCFESRHALRFRDALAAVIAGEALGTMMPLGMVVSEPAKAALVRHRVPFMVGLSAVAIENLFYSLSVALFIMAGMLALLFNFHLPKALRIASIAAVFIVIVVLFIAFVAIRKQWRFLSGLVGLLVSKGVAKTVFHEERHGRVRTLEDRVYGFYDQNRRRFLPLLALEACFHGAGVLEAYITLSFISDSFAPTFLMAFTLESVNRVITVVFKFIPLRLGVDEAGSGLITNVLGLGKAPGATLGIIRKGRDLVWTGVGLAILLIKGLSPTKVAVESEMAAVNEVTAASAASAVTMTES